MMATITRILTESTHVISLVRVESAGVDRPVVVTMSSGHLRPSIVHLKPNHARIALVGLVALLLAGDEVEIRVEVGEDVHLDLVEVAGTVAFNGGGVSSGWKVTAAIESRGSLRWHGLPFVAAEGSNVLRELTFDIAQGGFLQLRDTVVLGRTNEIGGVIDNRTRIEYDGRPVLVESQALRSRHEKLSKQVTHSVPREAAGMLQNYKIIDTYIEIGDAGTARQVQVVAESGSARESDERLGDAHGTPGTYNRFELPGLGLAEVSAPARVQSDAQVEPMPGFYAVSSPLLVSQMWRYLGDSAAASPIAKLLRK